MELFVAGSSSAASLEKGMWRTALRQSVYEGP